MAPRKRTLQENPHPAEPVLSVAQRTDFEEGRALFNDGRYWHAHESWEKVWLAMGNGAEDDAEIVIRGLIQLAAALHLLGVGRMDGAISNFRKSREKLRLAPPLFLGIDIPGVIAFVERSIDGGIDDPPPL